MSEVLQANIFFFISSVAAVIVTILLIVILYYVVQIVRNVRDITDRLREGSRLVANDLHTFHARILESGIKLQGVGSHLINRLFKNSRRGRRVKKETPEADKTVL